MFTNQVVVIDNGSETCKAGYAGDDNPIVYFPSMIGYPKGSSYREYEQFVGHSAEGSRGILKLSHPMQQGVIENYEDMTKIWGHCYKNGLGVDSEEHACLLTETSCNTKKSREKMTEIMFECFRVPGFYLAAQTALSLYSSGRVIGLVLNVGDGVTESVPVYDGYAVPYAIEKNCFAGRDLTEQLRKLINTESGSNFTTTAETRRIKEIKQAMCYVAYDYQQELSLNKGEKYYELPDHTHISIGKEMFSCPEILFKPQPGRSDRQSLQQMARSSINKCDIDLKKYLYSNIVLTGGSTMFPGLPERFNKELIDLAPNMRVEVSASPNRKFLSWIGGSILASLSTFKSLIIRQHEYKEYGRAIVHRKCF